MSKLNLEPSLTWQIFEEICAIPHPSGHEIALREHLRSRAEAGGLTTTLDNAGNLLVEKTATAGCENAKTVILQAHLDMVPQHAADIEFDPVRDPIAPMIEGEMVTTGGKTTLGADNGIGIALALDILLTDNYNHGPLKALFTLAEETGLNGAKGLDEKFLAGDILINLDSEDSNQVFIGCAGGTRMRGVFASRWQKTPLDYCGIAVALSGLTGGHSGCDIHKKRGNAVKIMAELVAVFPCDIAEFNGGTLENAIPRDTRVVFALPTTERDSAITKIRDYLIEQKNLRVNSDPNMQFQIEAVATPEKIWEDDVRQRVAATLLACPHGVIAMSDSGPDMVGTSINLARIETADDAITITTMPRSESRTKQQQIVAAVIANFETHGAMCTVDNEYPAWEPNVNSSILKIVDASFRELFGAEPQPIVMHAGLECGILGTKNPELELISLGPDIHNPHSPAECVNIVSVQRCRQLLVKTLEELTASSMGNSK